MDLVTALYVVRVVVWVVVGFYCLLYGSRIGMVASWLAGSANFFNAIHSPGTAAPVAMLASCTLGFIVVEHARQAANRRQARQTLYPASNGGRAATPRA